MRKAKRPIVMKSAAMLSPAMQVADEANGIVV